MAHITLSIPDKMYTEIKKHPEIKWSEAAREGIKRRLAIVGGVISGKELLKSLSPETRNALATIRESAWIEGYKKIKESEKRRLKSLTQALSSKRK